MICEYKNDIEIMFGNELTSWQIKSTTGNSVRPEEVYSSIRLFNFLKDTDKYSRFVLVSNRNFTRHDMKPLACYGLDHFLDLKSKIQRKFDGKLEENFLTKIKFMKGPEPDSIRSIISQQLSCLPNKKLLLEDLIFFIDNIWIGLKDITQFEMHDIEQRKNQDIDLKTITEERIKSEILNKKEYMAFHFESGATYVKDFEKINDIDEEEIKYLINKYKYDSEFRYNVLRKFDELSKTTKLYQSISFMKFLRKISKSEDQHELVAFVYILHNLILMSKTSSLIVFSFVVIKSITVV
jgi:hypothetical protein